MTFGSPVLPRGRLGIMEACPRRPSHAICCAPATSSTANTRSHQPELNLILSRPGPPALDAEAAEQVLALVAKGAMGGGIFRTEDCRATCSQLEARGLELAQQPDERFYGIDATFRDPSGNLWRIVQPLDYDIGEPRR